MCHVCPKKGITSTFLFLRKGLNNPTRAPTGHCSHLETWILPHWGASAHVTFEGDVVLIHPGRLTAGNLRIYPWKRKSIFQSMTFRFYLNLPECKCTVDFLYIINQHFFDQITMKITLTMKKAGKQLKSRVISGHFFREKNRISKPPTQ